MTFGEWMEGRSQSDLARALGTTRQAVNNWMTGRSRPTLYYALAIRVLSGGRVGVEDWLTAQEQAALRGLAL